jgi:hypothetical protein
MTDRARYWRQLVAQWQKSGLSQAEFCRRRRIKAVSFGWWKRKLQGLGKNRRRRVDPSTGRARTRRDADFLEVALPDGILAASSVGSTSSTVSRTRLASPIGPSRYEIALSGGRVIRLPQDFDPSVVFQLIAVVESC